MTTAKTDCVTVIPPDEYVAVNHYSSDDYAVSVESLTDAHGPVALPDFMAWWVANREVRLTPLLPNGIGGIFVKDYLDWVADMNMSLNPLPPGRVACRWCKDAGTVTLATSTQPCLDCAAGKET